jgi:hypothetical protein
MLLIIVIIFIVIVIILGAAVRCCSIPALESSFAPAPLCICLCATVQLPGSSSIALLLRPIPRVRVISIERSMLLSVTVPAATPTASCCTRPTHCTAAEPAQLLLLLLTHRLRGTECLAGLLLLLLLSLVWPLCAGGFCAWACIAAGGRVV